MELFEKTYIYSHKNIGNVVFFVAVLSIIIGVWFVRNTNVEADIVPYPDTKISFSTKDKIIEQTWSPNAKRLDGIFIPFEAENTFDTKLKMTIVTDDNQIIATSIINYTFKEKQCGEIFFPLENVCVELGTRYHFLIEYSEESGEGIILINAGEHFYGCSVAGEEVGTALALKISLVKNSKIFWLVNTFFPIISIALFLACWCERKIEDTIGVAYILIATILYVIGLFVKIKFGIWVVLILGFVLFLYSFIYIVKNEKSIFDFFTPGLVVYCIITLGLIIICRDFVRMEWDEYSHWGLAVKDMFYYDALSMHEGSSVLAKRYPPFSTIIEYYFMYNNEMFSEGIMYVAYLSFVWSMLVIAFKNIKWHEIREIFLTGIIILLLPLFFFDFYYSLYVDLLLGIVFSYILISYYSDENSIFNNIRIMVSLCALVLVKDMGLVLACIFVIIAIIDCLSEKKLWYADRRKLFGIFGYSLITIFGFLSWQLYLFKNQIDQSSETSTVVSVSGINTSNIIELFSMQSSPYKYEVLKSYFKTIIYGSTYEIGNIEISYMGIILFLIVATYFINQTDKENKKNKASFIYGAFVGAILYSMFLLMTYLFIFPEYDATVLHSHKRYLGSYIGGIVVAFVCINVIQSKKQKNYLFEKIKVIIVFVLIFSAPAKQINPQMITPFIKKEMLQEYEEQEKLLRSFADKKEKIYYIYNNSSHALLETHIYRNYCSPLRMDGGNMYGSLESIENEYRILEEKNEPHMLEIYKNVIPVKQWEQILQDYDYVYLHKPGYTFTDSYGSVFEDVCTVGDRTYYKVIDKGERIMLRYIGEVH